MIFKSLPPQWGGSSTLWKGRSLGDRLPVLQNCREAERHQKQQDRGPPPPNICLLRQSNASTSARFERLVPQLNVLVITSVFLLEKEREGKKILSLMFVLLEQAALGVWLSTPISAAVTFNSPIITATVAPPASLQQALATSASVSTLICSRSGLSISASHNKLSCKTMSFF